MATQEKHSPQIQAPSTRDTQGDPAPFQSTHPVAPRGLGYDKVPLPTSNILVSPPPPGNGGGGVRRQRPQSARSPPVAAGAAMAAVHATARVWSRDEYVSHMRDPLTKIAQSDTFGDEIRKMRRDIYEVSDLIAEKAVANKHEVSTVEHICCRIFDHMAEDASEAREHRVRVESEISELQRGMISLMGQSAVQAEQVRLISDFSGQFQDAMRQTERTLAEQANSKIADVQAKLSEVDVHFRTLCDTLGQELHADLQELRQEIHGTQSANSSQQELRQEIRQQLNVDLQELRQELRGTQNVFKVAQGEIAMEASSHHAEIQKQLSAANTHATTLQQELRTHITVLQGQLQGLIRHAEEQLSDQVKTSAQAFESGHSDVQERFVASNNQAKTLHGDLLQKLHTDKEELRLHVSSLQSHVQDLIKHAEEQISEKANTICRELADSESRVSSLLTHWSVHGDVWQKQLHAVDSSRAKTVNLTSPIPFSSPLSLIKTVEHRGNIRFDMHTGVIQCMNAAWDFVPVKIHEIADATLVDDKRARLALKDTAELATALAFPLLVEGHTQVAGGSNEGFFRMVALKRGNLIKSMLEKCEIPSDKIWTAAYPWNEGVSRCCVTIRFMGWQPSHASSLVDRHISSPRGAGAAARED